MLSERRDEATATAFFAKAVASNGWPDKVVIDQTGLTGLEQFADLAG